MSDDSVPGDEQAPKTSIRPAQPRQGQVENIQPSTQPYTQPVTQPFTQVEPQQWGPPGQQSGQHSGQQGAHQQPGQGQPQQQHAQGQPEPPYGQQPYGQQPFGQQQDPQWSQQQAAPAHAPQQYPAPGGGKRSSGRRMGGIGLLAGALILGAGAGFGGGYLHGETSGDSGNDGSVDAGQIDIGGVNLQDLVSVQTVADKTLPSVVKIEAYGSSSGSTGSGIVLSDDGMILTNYHVAYNGMDGGETRVYFSDGSSSSATVVGADPDLDIAVIKAEDASDLTPIEFGEADDLHVGQAVVAVGSPYGLESTVTAGIISTVNRPVNVPGMDSSQEAMIYPALQTDAAINPGNSGGALVNIKGQLVGMNSGNRVAKDDTGSTGDLGSIGIGFAIPVNVLEPIIEQLKNGESPTHAWLGIIPGNARESGVAQGARVDDFTSGSPAEEAGLQTGDVVVHIDDYPISQGLGLVTTALNYRPGDEVTVTVVRDGEKQDFEVTLGERERLFEGL